MWKDKWIHLNKLICSSITKNCPNMWKSLLWPSTLENRTPHIWKLDRICLPFYKNDRYHLYTKYLTKLYFSFFFSKYSLKSLLTWKAACLSKYKTSTHTLTWFEFSLASPRYSKQSLTIFHLYRYFIWKFRLRGDENWVFSRWKRVCTILSRKLKTFSMITWLKGFKQVLMF